MDTECFCEGESGHDPDCRAGSATRQARGVRFAFSDSATFDGLTDDTTWNGFLNVSVTAAELEVIKAWFAAQVAARREDPSVLEADYWPPVVNGRADLSGGFATHEVRSESGVCPDCEYPLLDHLSADECEAHGIDAGLRDGLGCAVVARAGSSLQPRETDLQERALVENIFPGTPEWDASEIALADQRRKGG